MKKSWSFLGLALVAIVAIAVDRGIVYARVTGTGAPTVTETCWGAVGAEICVDTSGNVIPTTNATQSLGTTALRFTTAFINTLTNSTSLVTSGTVQVNGVLSNGVTQVGTLSGGAVGQGIYVSSQILPTSNYITFISSGVGAGAMTSTPTISTTTTTQGTTGWPSGTFITITSTSSSGGIVLQDEGTLTGSRLQLGASTRQINQFDTITLVFDARDSFWREVSFTNN